jgi:hypothetical protein
VFGKAWRFQHVERQLDDAAKADNESIGLRRKVITQDPADNASQLRLAHVLGYDAYALIFGGHAEDSTRLAQESLSISSKLVSMDENNAAWRREYVESLNFTAMAMFYTGHPSEALQG